MIGAGAVAVSSGSRIRQAIDARSARKNSGGKKPPPASSNRRPDVDRDSGGKKPQTSPHNRPQGSSPGTPVKHVSAEHSARVQALRDERKEKVAMRTRDDGSSKVYTNSKGKKRSVKGISKAWKKQNHKYKQAQKLKQRASMESFKATRSGAPSGGIGAATASATR